jgi:ubiquinone/menaquinone biosynthesis C-methylase UbiE
MSTMAFDEDAAQAIEGLYRIADAVRRRRLARAALAADTGHRVLDVGCGPGFFCVELLAEVGPAGSVVGVDSSPPMLTLAARRCDGHDNVEFHQAEATSLPVDDAIVDRALCVQVLEYVADADAALAEMHRALRPGGRIVVWDVDWATVSIHAEDEPLNQRVLEAWDEHLVHPSLPRTLAARLRSVGFVDVGAEAHPFVTTEFDPETYGGGIVPFIAQFVVGRQGLSQDDAARWLSELQALGRRGEFYFASTQVCFTATKP